MYVDKRLAGIQAVQTLTRVVSLNPDSVQGRLTLAQALVGANNLAGAIVTRVLGRAS